MNVVNQLGERERSAESVTSRILQANSGTGQNVNQEVEGGQPPHQDAVAAPPRNGAAAAVEQPHVQVRPPPAQGNNQHDEFVEVPLVEVEIVHPKLRRQMQAVVNDPVQFNNFADKLIQSNDYGTEWENAMMFLLGVSGLLKVESSEQYQLLETDDLTNEALQRAQKMMSQAHNSRVNLHGKAARRKWYQRFTASREWVSPSWTLVFSFIATVFLFFVIFHSKELALMAYGARMTYIMKNWLLLRCFERIKHCILQCGYGDLLRLASQSAILATDCLTRVYVAYEKWIRTRDGRHSTSQGDEKAILHIGDMLRIEKVPKKIVETFQGALRTTRGDEEAQDAPNLQILQHELVRYVTEAPQEERERTTTCVILWNWIQTEVHDRNDTRLDQLETSARGVVESLRKAEFKRFKSTGLRWKIGDIIWQGFPAFICFILCKDLLKDPDIPDEVMWARASFSSTVGFLFLAFVSLFWLNLIPFLVLKYFFTRTD